MVSRSCTASQVIEVDATRGGALAVEEATIKSPTAITHFMMETFSTKQKQAESGSTGMLLHL